MNNNLRLNEDRVFLCARKNCCPTVSYTDASNKKVVIRDDDGRYVEMDKDQAKLIGKGIDLLDEQLDAEGRRLLEE